MLVLALILTGHRTFNADQVDHGEATVSLGSYLTQGHFWEAIFENWESEFLQMAAYIVLTVFLIQKDYRRPRFLRSTKLLMTTLAKPTCGSRCPGPCAEAACGSCSTRTRSSLPSTCSS